MKKILLLFLSLLLLLLFSLPAFAAGSRTVRVLLASGQSSCTMRVTNGEYQIVDLGKNLPIGTVSVGETITVGKSGTVLTVSKDGGDAVSSTAGILLRPQDASGLNTVSYKNVQYRDSMRMDLVSNTLYLVNHVDMEHYLYGVVGHEIGYGAPLEAIKAQAVASRSYAAFYAGRYLYYDVSATTSSQVYGGYSAELRDSRGNVRQAVDATAGKMLYYKNSAGKKEVVEAVFCGSAGGYTEAAQNVWNSSVPYLQAVESPYDDYAGNSSYEWTVTYTPEEVASLMQSYLNRQGGGKKFGTYQKIELSYLDADGKTKTASGRVTKAVVTGSGATVTINRDSIRSAFNLKSTRFTVSSGSAAAAEYYVRGSSGLVSYGSLGGLYTIGFGAAKTKLSKDDGLHVVSAAKTSALGGEGGDLIIHGYGNGHGVGMSQWGAMGMANAGYSYDKILYHYYTDVSLE